MLSKTGRSRPQLVNPVRNSSLSASTFGNSSKLNLIACQSARPSPRIIASSQSPFEFRFVRRKKQKKLALCNTSISALTVHIFVFDKSFRSLKYRQPASHSLILLTETICSCSSHMRCFHRSPRSSAEKALFVCVSSRRAQSDLQIYYPPF